MAKLTDALGKVLKPVADTVGAVGMQLPMAYMPWEEQPASTWCTTNGADKVINQVAAGLAQDRQADRGSGGRCSGAGFKPVVEVASKAGFVGADLIN